MIRQRRFLNPSVFLVSLTILSALPFVFQAFHIDDRLYIEIADQIRADPLFPYDYQPLFEGLITPDAASHSHLPLTSYYIAGVTWLSGGPVEWVLHIAFWIFPCLAVWAFYGLASRFLLYPQACALLLCLAPGVFVLSHTLMTEVPLLAFWLVAVARFITILEGEASRQDWILCAVALLAAAFMSLLTVGLLILLAAGALFWFYRPSEVEQWGKPLPTAGSRSPASPGTVALLLLLPVLLWAAWYLRAYFHYDRLVLIRLFQHLDQRQSFTAWLFLSKALSYVLNLGAIFVFPLVAWFGFARKRTGILALMAGLTGFVAAILLGGWPVNHAILLALFLSTGVLILVEFSVWTAGEGLVRRPESGRNSRGLYGILLCWFFGIFASYVMVYPSGSARYMLLALPPVLIVWQRCLEARIQNRYFLRNLLGLCIVLNLAYSGWIGYSDYLFSGMYRESARQLVKEWSQPGRTIWFTSEWGFRHYLEESGARYLTRTSNEPKAGDVILKPFVVSKWVTLYDSSEFVRLLEQKPLTYSSPVRLMDFSSRAGFYSTAWGVLPYSFPGEDEPWEWVNVFEVRKRYDGPVPEPERHW